ncbi:TRAP transporter large permease [Klebsiella sp. I138]|uniref:TRAP transporter large permease n=1 Tax=Klebsiella sp. I138 TaxID=2755385 RepID=UPI003DA82D0A
MMTTAIMGKKSPIRKALGLALVALILLAIGVWGIQSELDASFFIPISMFIALSLLIFSGYPVAYVLGGTGMLFGFIASQYDLFSMIEFFNILPRAWQQLAENLTLVAGPMFIFMGILLERSGIAVDLLDAIRIITRRVPGGMALGVVLIGGILGAMTGVVSATVIMMTTLALPSMQRAGYSNALSCGTIAAAGTIGIIIPPSVMLVFMGDVLQVSIGRLFMATIGPAMLNLLLYIVLVITLGFFFPKMAPKAVDVPDHSPHEMLLIIVKGILAPVFLILMVLGSIFAGWATPTEAAAVGALGAFLLTVLKRRFTLSMLNDVVQSTAFVSAMIFFIVFGATVFSYVFRSIGGEHLLIDAIESAGFTAYTLLLVLVVVTFFVGFFFDWIEISLIFLPIFGPIIATMTFNYDFVGRGDVLVWFGVIVGLVLQTSFLTPPFGYTLLYMRGAITDKSIKMTQIYTGVIPFVILQLLVVILVIAYPKIALWLPVYIFGG